MKLDVTTRVSVRSSGAEGSDGGDAPSISADGRFVAFESSSQLVPADHNGQRDIYVHDRVTGRTTRVSVTSTGAEATGSSYGPTISADGRFVAFSSDAEDLVGNDSNVVSDIFVHDRQTGRTKRVSLRTDGSQAIGGDSSNPSISPDGRWVAFGSFAGDFTAGDIGPDWDVFLYDRREGRIRRVSDLPGAAEPDGESSAPVVSEGGRHVAFWSEAADLVGDDLNGQRDVFVWTRSTDAFERVSVRSNEQEVASGAPSTLDAPSMSADGRYVAFDAGDPMATADDDTSRDVYVRDRTEGITRLVSLTDAGDNAVDNSSSPAISTTGAWVVFESESVLTGPDPRGYYDVFRRGPLI
jgi:Tol biopolymer transport system component